MNDHVNAQLVYDTLARLLELREPGVKIQAAVRPKEPETQNAAPGGNDTWDGGQKSENPNPRDSASHYTRLEAINQ